MFGLRLGGGGEIAERMADTKMSDIQLFQNPAQKSIQTCIDEVYDSFKVPRLGGASTDGWSKLADFQRCPYRYWAKHLLEVGSQLTQVGEAPAALEIGSLFHAMLACHYIGSIPAGGPEYPTALEFINRMLTLGANATIVAEAERLYMAYFDHYGNPSNEGISPLAIELGAGIPGIHTCRYDMLATIHGGTWIVEHKTASRETRDVLESWWLDGEIIGEVYGYKLSGLEKVYGPLVGVLVNVVIKTKEPKFRRIEVVIPDSLLARYAADADYWHAQRDAAIDAASFPRKLQGCIGRYDTCQFWDHCRDADATDSGRMMSLLQASIDKGNV